MYDNIEGLIEDNLKRIVEQAPKQGFSKYDLIDENGKETEDLRFAEYMEARGLIKIEPVNREWCNLTEFGYKVYKNGGWLKHLEREVEKRKVEKELEKLSNEKLKHETKLVKFNFKYRRWYLGITIGSAIIALSSLIYTYKYNESEAKVLKEQTKNIDIKMNTLNDYLDSVVNIRVQEKISDLEPFIESKVSEKEKQLNKIRKKSGNNNEKVKRK